MDNKKEIVQQSIETASQGFGKAAESMCDAIIAIMDKLAGKKSDVKLSFEDLVIETGPMKAKVNGSIVLDIVYSVDAEPAS